LTVFFVFHTLLSNEKRRLGSKSQDNNLNNRHIERV
jgi:hypothetical protein